MGRSLPGLLGLVLTVSACQQLISHDMREPKKSQAADISKHYTELAQQAGGRSPRFALGVPTMREAAFVLLPLDDGAPSAATVTCRSSTPPGSTLTPVETRFGSSRRVAVRTEPDQPGAVCHVDDPRGAFDVPLAFAPTATPDAFSFVAHSCNSPFVTHDEKDDLVALAHDTRAVYQLLQARGNGSLRMRGMPDRPSFGLGMGDQLYLDPDNEGDEAKLSLLGGERTNELRVKMSEVPSLMRQVYRATFGLPGLREAYETIPHAMVWDDHDISDGWGSQGHEWSPLGRQYFKAARDVFLEYQGSRNPTLTGQPLRPAWVKQVAEGTHLPLDVSFRWGDDITVFMLDDRSERRSASLDPDQRRVFQPGSGQLRRLAARLASLPSGQPATMILMLPLPLVFTISQKRLAMALGNVSVKAAEQLDDTRDSWSSNPHDLGALLTVLLPHFDKEPRHRLLIVSGDVHRSGMYRLTLAAGDRPGRTIGYEIVSSGIAEYIGPTTACLVESVLHIREKLTLDTPTPLHLAFSPLGYLDGTPLFAEVSVRRDATLGHTFRAAFLAGRQGYPDEECLDSPPRLPRPVNHALGAELAAGGAVTLSEQATFDLDAMPESEHIPCRKGHSIAVRAADAVLPDGTCYRANLFDKIDLERHRER